MDLPAKPGDRIRLIDMPDDPNPIAVGEMGTVRSVAAVMYGGKPETHIGVDWDCGRTLSLILPFDKFEVVRSTAAVPF